MANLIHPTAIVHKEAKIGDNVKIGPFSIVEKNTSIGDNTEIGSSVLIKEFSSIGQECKIFKGAVVGEIPMDLKFEGEKSSLQIGDRTTVESFVHCTEEPKIKK